MKNIFDLENTDDLSESLKISITRGVYNNMKDCSLLLSLFDLKDNLSISEMMVGMYRKYKLEKSRKWVQYTLVNLKLYKKVKNIGEERGIYTKYENNKCPPPAPEHNPIKAKS